jgi:hypothetical protein
MKDTLLRCHFRGTARLLACIGALALPAGEIHAQDEPSAKTATGKWQTYRNDRYMFRLSYPPDGQIQTRRDRQFQYVRIQNHETDPQGALQPGEYYLQVFIFDHRVGHKMKASCRELVAGAHPVKAGKVNALRGSVDEADLVTTPYALCLQGVKVDVLVTANEEDQVGALANRILDSVRFGN